MLCAGLLLTGCGSGEGALNTLQVGDDEVQIIRTDIAYSGGGTETLFLISPFRDRPMDERISVARASLKQDGACRLATEDPGILRAMTAKHTAGPNDQLLIAPVKC